jgi:microcystin-dependent protein
MRKLVLISLFLIGLPGISFARQQAQANLAYSDKGLYTVFKGTFAFTDTLNVFPTSATYNSNVLIEGAKGNVRASRFYGDGSNLTNVNLVGNVSAANILPGYLNTSVICSSITVGKVVDNNIVNISASKIKSGNLGASVVCSSITIGKVIDNNIVSISASKINSGSLGASVIASSIAVNSVPLNTINAGGTRNSGTYLSGNGMFSAPAGSDITPNNNTWIGTNTFIKTVTISTYAYISQSNIVPAGVISMWGGATAPSTWLICDGTTVSTITYRNLFLAIGYTYGGSGVNMVLPDFRGVFPKGAGTTNRTLGKDANGNAYSATLGQYLQDKMQGHKHATVDDSIYGLIAGGGVVPTNAGTSGDPISALSSHNTDVPKTDGTNGTPRTGLTTEPQSLGVNFIIKY